MDNIYNKIVNTCHKRGGVSFALIDPDMKNDLTLQDQLKIINESDFDFLLIGGSLIIDNNYNKRIDLIKSISKIPLILFPGSAYQITNKVDAMLYISLLSGNNPQYLIGEHIQSAGIIYNMNLETIPTGYILVDGGSYSSVAAISKTLPLPNNKFDIIAAHALAGQYLGMKLIYLEAGSGSNVSVDPDLISFLKKKLKIPIVIGGGIKEKEQVLNLVKSGANYFVIGTAIENKKNQKNLIEINQVIHGKN